MYLKTGPQSSLKTYKLLPVQRRPWVGPEPPGAEFFCQETEANFYFIRETLS